MRYILDTNSLSDYLRNGSSTLLGSRIAAIPAKRTNLRTTVITFQEMLNGRIKELEKDAATCPRPVESFEVRYAWLVRTYFELRRYFPPLPFNLAARTVYDTIPRSVRDQAKIRDCRIASIQVALGVDWTVITADQKDFRKIEKVIPVQWDDWTIAPLT